MSSNPLILLIILFFSTAGTDIPLLRRQDGFIDECVSDGRDVAADDIITKQSEREAEEPRKSIDLINATLAHTTSVKA